jgi:diaminohydroxyphosphoribosylaminopyrimidine deaminase/5-amino-6-(5-phosphoribosylamino)uracil reductase
VFKISYFCVVNTHEKYIKRCIQIAKNGLSAAMPNPSVGAVIVVDGIIIGEGFTSAYGGAHAEVNAIQSVKDTSLLKKATLYVSLEPCSHFGKTPPCCDLIIQHKIPNVVIGTVDPHIKVAGNGIKKLMEAGCNVTVGVLEQECFTSNKRFFTFHQKNRPYIILKWAESQDGFIAPVEKREQKPVWISNSFSRQLAHQWRTEEHAILVGTQTVADDNPVLTARDWSGRNPIRTVIDQHLRLSKKSHIFNDQAETIVISSEVIDFNAPVASQIAALLFRHGIQSVIVEGGRQTLQTFIDENIWDEARVFKGTPFLRKGTPAPVLKKGYVQKRSCLDDELLIFENND